MTFCCILTAVSILSVVFWRSNQIRRVEQFRKIKVGEKIPGFSASSIISGIDMSPTDPQGRFYIHFVNDKLPSACLNLECGEDAKYAQEKGGHLLGFADGKAAYSFGIDIKLKPYRFDASIMAVTDNSAKIIAIYEQAQLSDLKTILDDLAL